MSDQDKKLADAIDNLPTWKKFLLHAFCEKRVAEIDLEIAEENVEAANQNYQKVITKIERGEL